MKRRRTANTAAWETERLDRSIAREARTEARVETLARLLEAESNRAAGVATSTPPATRRPWRRRRRLPPDGIRLHRLTEPDLELARDAVTILHGTTPPEALLAELLGNPSVYWIAALIDDKPAGHLVAYQLDSIVGLSMLFVHMLEVESGRRRQGVGTLLVDATKRLCEVTGIASMWLTTQDDNKPALALYRAAGGRVGKSRRVVEWSFD